LATTVTGRLALEPTLDPEQRAAATLPDRPAQIIAPAGSGKTTTMVARLAVLLSRGVTQAVLEAYADLLRIRGAVDFDDLVVRACELLATNARLRLRWQSRFSHVCVARTGTRRRPEVMDGCWPDRAHPTMA